MYLDEKVSKSLFCLHARLSCKDLHKLRNKNKVTWQMSKCNNHIVW